MSAPRHVEWVGDNNRETLAEEKHVLHVKDLSVLSAAAMTVRHALVCSAIQRSRGASIFAAVDAVSTCQLVL